MTGGSDPGGIGATKTNPPPAAHFPEIYMGAGGGGGWAAADGTASNGGPAAGYGAGGGGGGASISGHPSGAGARGVPGIAVIIARF